MASTEIGGSVTPNPNGSNDVNLNIARSIGDDRLNASVGAFVAANDQRGPSMGTVGAFGAVNAHGHGASMTVSHIPKFNVTTVDATATANVWTSANRASSINLNANATQHIGGPMRGHRNLGGSVIFKRTF